MVASPVTVAITSHVVGRIADRYDLMNIILCGIFVITVGAIGMSFLSISFGLVGYILCLMTIGCGYATFTSSNNTLTMSGASPNVRGSISGILNLSRNLGLLTGASLMSTVFDSVSFISHTSTLQPASLEEGLNAVYRLAVGLLIGAIVIHLFAKHKQKYATTPSTYHKN